MKVDYIMHMGDDKLVINAARVSFDKWHDEFQDNDKGLISYLAKHKHISPFFHPQICLRVTVPFFVANQLKRHQVGFAINESSRRYIDTPPEFYYVDKLGARAENKKQGAKDGEFITETFDGRWDSIEEVTQTHYAFCLHLYSSLLENNVAPEDARIVLPQATYTSFIWTGSLYAFARLYNLRSKPDSQRQTREVAEMISDIAGPLFPHSWQALCQNSV